MSARLRVALAGLVALVGGLLPITAGSAATGTWTSTGSMSVARADAMASSLLNGDVLVAGGGGCSAALASAELYHASGPAAGTWTSAGNMSVGRYMGTATLLGDGKVLVTGGNTSACTPTATAELYDPTSNSWTATGSMQFARSSFTATRVADQSVVVAGGFGNQGVANTTEEYSEGSGTWSPLASMNVGRWEHAAVALPRSGASAVMVVGGNTGAGITTNVEIGEKLPGAAGFAWAQQPSMNVSRDDFTATLLSTGNVLAVGGSSNSGFNQNTAEVFGTAWTQVANMGSIRTRHTATSLSNGQVLVAGGSNTFSLSTAELYDPVSATWTSTAPMNSPRSDAVAAALPNGGVLVAGGVPGLSAGPLASAEVFAPPSASNPPPVLNAVSPASGQAGEPATTLTVSGTGFISGSVVEWNGTDLPTTYVGTTQLSATVPSADLAAPTCATLTVVTPAPGGGASQAQAFSVVPSLSGAGEVGLTGADCGGTIDATQPFVTALNQLQAQGGGTLSVPPGRYLVRPDTLTVHGNTTVAGNGATLVSSAAGYILLDLSGSNIEVDGLTVDGATQVLHIVEVEKGATNLTLRGVTAQNSGQVASPASPNPSAQTVGIRVQGDGRGMLFDGISVRNVVANHSDTTSMVARGLLLDNGGGALTVSKQVTVQNSSFVNVGPKDDGDCLVIQGSTDTNADLLITNNSFDQCAKRAIKLQVGGVNVVGNAINNPYHGNNKYNVRPESFDVATGKPTFDMFSAVGIFSSNILVSGNTTSGTGSFYDGVEIDSIGGTPQNLSIMRNTISNGAGSETIAPSSSIRSSVPVANLTVRSNKFTNALAGVYLEEPVTGASIGCNTYTSVATPMANPNGTEQPCNVLPAAPQAPRQSLAIPSYIYPGGAWNQLNAGSPTVGLAVINPFNGPASAINFDYVNQVQQSRARGVTVLGYVPTGHGSRATADIKHDIDTYYTWYDVDGIFLDEASNDCALEPTYADLNTYVKAKGGIGLTVLNPGTQTGECYMAAADILVTFENDMNTYLTSYTAPSWVANYPASRFWHLVYATPTDQQMQDVISLSKTRGAGWIDVTPDVLDNPWDTLPSDPYWSDELAAAQQATLPASAPILASLIPTSAEIQSAGGPGVSITLTGTGFSTTSVVQWKRPTDSAPTALSTSFVSGTQLTAIVPSSSLSATGAAELSVLTPAPGGGGSAPQPFFLTATAAALAAPPISQTSSSPTGTVQVSTVQSSPGTAGGVSASASGSGTLTLAQYTANPQALTPAGGATNYFDVHLASGSSFSTVSVVDCDLSGASSDPAYGIVLWWNGASWTPVSNQTPGSPNAFCTSFSLSSTSSPSVTQLVGSEFAVVVDRTPPSVMYTGASATFGVLDTVHVLCSATDNVGGSGIASTTCKDVTGPAYSFAPGVNSFSASATDRAGNVGTGSFTFTLRIGAGDLCTLTMRFVQGSTKYQALPVQDRSTVDLVTKAVCAQLATASNPSITQKARLVTDYQVGIGLLVRGGWLTQSQAATLIALSRAW